MSGVQRLESVSRNRDEAAVYGAWERFVQGENDICGVRPEVAISWHRCRDQYHVDPYLSEAPAAVAEVAHGAGVPVHLETTAHDISWTTRR